MAVALGGLVPGMIEGALRRRGFTEPALVLQWRSIVGPELADRTSPLRVAFPARKRTGGVLHIRVEGPFAVELQHIAPQVVERLNGFYGYAALDRLALHQAPVAPPTERGGG